MGYSLLSEMREEIEMSLKQGIKHNKEHREEYRGIKKDRKDCRNHGGCFWCEENRMYRYLRCKEAMDDAEDEYYDMEEI